MELTADIVSKLDTIQKNRDYCKENNCPEALNEGGKFFKNFTKLIEDTVQMEKNLIGQYLQLLLPYSSRKEEDIICSLINDAIKEQKITLNGATELSDRETLEQSLELIKSSYIDKYIDYRVKKITEEG